MHADVVVKGLAQLVSSITQMAIKSKYSLTILLHNRYKCPLLRGCVDPLITKHSKVEALLTSNLENWLSNLYFEVIKLPRYVH